MWHVKGYGHKEGCPVVTGQINFSEILFTPKKEIRDEILHGGTRLKLLNIHLEAYKN